MIFWILCGEIIIQKLYITGVSMETLSPYANEIQIMGGEVFLLA